MLILLPLLTFAALLVTLRAEPVPRQALFREDLLLAALVWSVAIAAGSELLGGLHALSFRGVLGFWIGFAALCVLAGEWRRRRHRAPLLTLRRDVGRGDFFLLGGITGVALVTLVVAALAPPQSPDSLGYHMSRVVHWIQNRTLAHYPTYDDRQLASPPLAELIRLHLLVLTGGDRVAGLLQWGTAIGCLIAVSLVIRELGGDRPAQLLGAVFAITLPIGITQASSGKNDWVAAFWLLVLVHALLRVRRAIIEDSSPRRALAAVGAALGLALLTKMTSWFFAFPFVLAVVAAIPRHALRRLARPAVAALALAVAINAPHWWRNISLYGDPVAYPLVRHRFELKRVPVTVASNMLRNMMSQLGTPSDRVNHLMERGVAAAHGLWGADPQDPQTTGRRPFGIRRPTTIEEEAGSPLHLLLLLAVGIAVLASRRQGGAPVRQAYLPALAGAYVLFCAFVKWQPPNARLLLPLFVAAAPLVGLTLARGRWGPTVAAVLLVASMPWLVGTEGRPLSMRPGYGVLATPRQELYFARFPALRGPYMEAARTVRELGVRDVGLALVNPDEMPEYPLWVLLADGGPAVRLEHVRAGSSRILARRPPFADFRPALIIVEQPTSSPPPAVTRVAGTAYRLLRATGPLALYVRPPAAVAP